MKTKTGILIGGAVLIAATFIVPSLLVDGEKKWRTEKVYGGDASFVQLEINSGKPVAAFSTDSGIVVAEKRLSGFTWLHPVERYLGDTGWRLENVTEDENAGFYLSMKERNGQVYMAHQHSSLGDRKLGYTHRENGSWSTEEVDSSSGTGLEPGMYASLTWLRDDPIILYHTAEGDQFVKAERSNGSWDREVLGTGRGWYTSSDNCGKKAFFLYSSREEQSLYRGTITGEDWRSQKIDAETESSTSVDAGGCVFRAAYHSSGSGEVIYRSGGTEESVAEARLSRLSLDYREKPRISYYDHGTGLYYATRGNDEWSSKLVDGNRSYAGEYNELETYSNGKPGIVYTTDSGVFYTEYRKDAGIELYHLLRSIAVLTALLALPAAIYVRYELVELRSKLFKEFRTKI